MSAASSERRSRTKRRLLWPAAGMGLLMSYVLGAPVVAGIVQTRFPAVEPVIIELYAPLIFYSQHPEIPGSDLFKSYASAVERTTIEVLR